VVTNGLFAIHKARVVLVAKPHGVDVIEH
jgi:hypothetical protein